ncbi:hypothetical protein SYNPS1DRAFT_23664 [Syncephalis pseudoplumigaleata]|uniref:Uncharacterized protein n=1 Tax=Syncephalis pseudoplumigaleata TaxID=1712513 RepID=A0A4P9YVY7_9FUNG|nr:hypothetical protein SYNPS1DRAFT_23664 [Syncephalis pseudoplumigaleata]|eukprot:RKP24243.1 hypothetical protein SYNPS1DRAFT_23664 [Syncephalis pseudoplumigaleata]
MTVHSFTVPEIHPSADRAALHLTARCRRPLSTLSNLFEKQPPIDERSRSGMETRHPQMPSRHFLPANEHPSARRPKLPFPLGARLTLQSLKQQSTRLVFAQPPLPPNVAAVRERLQAISASVTDLQNNDRVQHYHDHAPFYLLQLIAQLFRTDTARNALCMATGMKWVGMHVRYQSARKKHYTLEVNYNMASSRKYLTPIQYVQQVVDASWDCLRVLARSPSSVKPYECDWLLRQFCIIYGLVVTELNLYNAAMLEHLQMIAALPSMAGLLNFNAYTLACVMESKPWTAMHGQGMGHILPPASHTANSMSGADVPSTSWAEAPASTMDDRTPMEPLTESTLGPGQSSQGRSLHGVLASEEDAEEMDCDGGSIRARILQQVMRTFLSQQDLATLPADIMARLIHELPQTCLPLDGQVTREFNLCVEFLVDDANEMDPLDIATASHWLRESPDRAELRKINAMGLEAYRERYYATLYRHHRQPDHQHTASPPSSSDAPGIDPRLVAAHLKYVCQQIPHGLITDAVRDALLALMPPHVCTEDDWQPTMAQVNTMRLLLQTNMARLRLLGQIMRVIRRILEIQQVDQITPLGLAVLLPITSGSEVTNIVLLKRWHLCLSILISRVWDVFHLARTHTTLPATSITASDDRHDWKWVVELDSDGGKTSLPC